VKPLRVAGSRRKKIDDEQIHALIENVGCLLDERPNRMAAVFVSRRDNLDDRHDLSPAMANDHTVGTLGIVDFLELGDQSGRRRSLSNCHAA
jgi:hypothetical protein